MPFGPSGNAPMGGNMMSQMMSAPGGAAASGQPGPPGAGGMGSSVLARLLQGSAPTGGAPDDQQRFIQEATQQDAQVQADTQQAAMDAFMKYKQEQQAWAMQQPGEEGELSGLAGSPVLAALLGGGGSAGTSMMMQQPLQQKFPQVPPRTNPPASMSM